MSGGELLAFALLGLGSGVAFAGLLWGLVQELHSDGWGPPPPRSKIRRPRYWE